MSSIYDFSFRTLQGTKLNLADYRGKVLLIANIARKCGFTPQMTDLQKLWEKYMDEGLQVLGFPSNSFLFQEPGDSETILCSYEDMFMIDFPMAEKSSMLWPDMNPLFAWMTSEEQPEEVQGFIKWNFTKFLISRNGEIRYRFGPTETPLEFEDKIRLLLSEKD